VSEHGTIGAEPRRPTFVVVCAAAQRVANLREADPRLTTRHLVAGVVPTDAAYLALAARRGLSMATADHRLARACTQAGVELVG
jgi:predicted nucleic acid-binding protein